MAAGTGGAARAEWGLGPRGLGLGLRLRRGDRGLDLVEGDRAVLALGGAHPRAVGQPAVEDRAGERLLERAADVALQRASAELLVEAVARQPGHERGVDLELDAALGAQAVGDPGADERA